MSDRDAGAVDFAAAFALGALFGAGIALFLAPDSGEKTRKKMKKKGERLRKDADRAIGDAREVGEEWLDEAEERMVDLTAEMTRAVEQGVATIRGAVSQELDKIEKKLGRKRGLFG